MSGSRTPAAGKDVGASSPHDRWITIRLKGLVVPRTKPGTGEVLRTGTVKSVSGTFWNENRIAIRQTP